MRHPAGDHHDYLDPAVLAKINNLELRARLVIEGFLSGMHHSPHRGLSVEFADHRVYSQGDDLRHVDWKLFGKTDKYYIKEYEQETSLDLMIAVDCSESMSYRSTEARMTKHDYATSLAAAIAYLTLRQQDSVGLTLFDEKVTRYMKPSNSAQHWKILVRELAGRTGPRKTALGATLSELADRLHRPMLVLVISDLFEAPSDRGGSPVDHVLRGFKRLQYRHHELIIWNLWDEAELTFPFNGWTRFDGLEDGGRLLADPGSLRTNYLAEVDRFQSRLRTACGKMHADYSIFDTSQPLDVVLAGYLATRRARLRQRSSRVLGRG